MPVWLDSVLTLEEVAAVYAHECGHRHHLHVWRNLMLACCFMRPGMDCRLRQEWQADDYACERGYGQALVAALRKLSLHPDAIARAQRIERNFALTL